MAAKPTKTADASVRERLLDAADRLFYREGIRAVGIDRVLAEAGAAKASMYAHFGSKDELIAAYVERRIVATRDAIDSYVGASPPEQRALRAFDFMVTQVNAAEFRGCPIQHLVGEIPDNSHPARVLAESQRGWLVRRFEEWVRATGNTEVKRLAGALMVLFDGAVSASLQDGPKRAREARWAAEQLLSR